jgi:hypothetical protein
MTQQQIIEAHNMVEQWRNTGKFCCIHISSDYNYCWRIEVFEHMAERHEPVYIVDGIEDFYEAVVEMNKKLLASHRDVIKQHRDF